MRRVVFDPPEIEYLGGRPYEKLSLKRTHAVVQLAVCKIFERCAGGQGVTGPEWRVHLSSTTSLVPDVAFVTYDRLRPLSEEQAEDAFHVRGGPLVAVRRRGIVREAEDTAAVSAQSQK